MPVPDWEPLCARFLALPQTERAETVLLFCGTGREPDTGGIAETLLRRGKRVAMPRCLPGGGMEARRIRGPEDLSPGAYGIPEPGEDCPVLAGDEIDLILVPCVCCDRAGRRLGRGGGYYDRYLKDLSCPTVALCPDEWLQTALPADGWDRPVDLVLTGTGRWQGPISKS